MSGTLRLKIVTPEGSLLDEDVASVTARSEVGEFCVLPEHCSILASLSAGRFIVEATDGTKTGYVVDNGFFEGGADHTSVITQKCILIKDINIDQVTDELSNLSKKIDSLSDDDHNREELNLKINWAQAQIDSASS